jgi:hypothetical protein
VGVRGSLPPSYIGWRQAVVEGIFSSAPPHRPPLHQCCHHERDRPRRCHGRRSRALGARTWVGPPRAYLHMAASPLLLEHRGMVGSAWFCTKLAYCSYLPLYAFQKAPSDSISLFPTLVSAIVIILLVYTETGQLHMYMCV